MSEVTVSEHNAIHLKREVAILICEGAYTPALRAIGEANVPTLQLAEQLCTEAMHNAQAAGQPYRQWQDRAILCRRRRQIILERAATSF